MHATHDRSWFRSSFDNAIDFLADLLGKCKTHTCLQGPEMHRTIAGYTDESVKVRFPPGQTGQSDVHRELGTPGNITRMPDATSWHYEAWECWIPHVAYCCEPVTCIHKLTFTFDAQGRLLNVTKSTQW
jgi:hypothetical protein